MTETPRTDTPPHDSRGEAGGETALIDETTAAELRARWDELQIRFVDTPRDAVAEADTLVAETIDHVRTGLEEARSELEERWNRGDEVSTEDLRQALRRYRWFLDRLLGSS